MFQRKGDHSSLLIFFPFQNNASKTLLAIMESRHDTENAERILYNMTPQQLVRLGQGYYQITEVDLRTLAFSCEHGFDQKFDCQRFIT